MRSSPSRSSATRSCCGYLRDAHAVVCRRGLRGGAPVDVALPGSEAPSGLRRETSRARDVLQFHELHRPRVDLPARCRKRRDDAHLRADGALRSRALHERASLLRKPGRDAHPDVRHRPARSAARPRDAHDSLRLRRIRRLDDAGVLTRGARLARARRPIRGGEHSRRRRVRRRLASRRDQERRSRTSSTTSSPRPSTSSRKATRRRRSSRSAAAATAGCSSAPSRAAARALRRGDPGGRRPRHAAFPEVHHRLGVDGRYGTPTMPDEFRTLLAYSPLHNLHPGTAYPATLIVTADHDDRVFPAHSFKFAAALQAAQGGPAPDPHPDRVESGPRRRQADQQGDRRGGGPLRVPPLGPPLERRLRPPDERARRGRREPDVARRGVDAALHDRLATPGNGISSILTVRESPPLASIQDCSATWVDPAVVCRGDRDDAAGDHVERAADEPGAQRAGVPQRGDLGLEPGRTDPNRRRLGRARRPRSTGQQRRPRKERGSRQGGHRIRSFGSAPRCHVRTGGCRTARAARACGGVCSPSRRRVVRAASGSHARAGRRRSS